MRNFSPEDAVLSVASGQIGQFFGYAEEGAKVVYRYDGEVAYARRADVVRFGVFGPETPVRISPIALVIARDWIADCEWADIASARGLSDQQVMAGIARHYAGGWAQLLADSAI